MREVSLMTREVCKMLEPREVRFAVLISGTGSNLKAILEAIERGDLHASVELIVSSNTKAKGIAYGEQYGIDTLVLEPSDYKREPTDPLYADTQIKEAALARGVTHLVMAGYMRMVTPVLLAAFDQRVINIHPALLPAFPGGHAIQDAFDAQVKVTGVTVHLADETYDTGPIIAQEPVRLDASMSLADLEAKIHEVEHWLYPQTLEMIAQEYRDNA